MRGRDAQVGRIAGRQFGVFSREQALASGFPETTIRRRVRTGAWAAPHPGVYHVAGSRLDWQGRGVAAWLACGAPAAIGGRMAAAFWGLGVEPSGVVSVLVPLSRRPAPAGVSVVRTRRWGRTEVARLGQLVVTSVPRTLLDLSAAGTGVEVALDAAHRLGRIHLPRLEVYLAHPSHRYLPGAGLLRRLVALRDPDRPIESGLETRLFALLRRYGLPLPVPQFWIRTRVGWRRIDFAYPDERLALEVDGREGHGPDRFEDDRARENELAEEGWERRHLTKAMIVDRPGDVAWTVAAGLGLVPVRWRGRARS